MSLRALIASVLLFSVSFLIAQIDSHYWTHQYGAKGLLLNGAVIASSDGETSIFYNPGSIGMDDNLGFAFSFLSPSYSSLQTTNFIGDGNRITDNGLSFSPGFLGVRFKPFKTNKIVAGVTAFERFKTDIKFTDRVVDVPNKTPTNPTGSPFFLFRADLDFSRRISEDWYGFGLFYKVSDRMGIGFTQFSVWHSQKLDFNLKKEIVAKVIPSQVSLSWRREFGYDLGVSSGFVTKFGWCYRHDKFNLGLTATSPLYGIVRKNAVYYTEDFRVDAAANPQVLMSVSNRNRVDLENFKSAYSLGLGIDAILGKTVISFSTEYFSPVSRYRLFEDADDSFDGTSLNPENIIINLNSKNKQVTNFGFGIQIKSSEKLTWLAGFRTDRDQNNSLIFNNTTEYLGTTGNVYHISGGGMFQFGKNQISLGLDIGYGNRKDGNQIADLSDVSSVNLFMITDNENVSSRFSSAMLFLTYDFLFYGITNNDEEEN